MAKCLIQYLARYLADGYRLMFEDNRHYEKREYIFDDRVLDPEHPEFLMYYGTPSGKQLAGFMFYARTHDSRGPQIGGNITLWHYHVWSTRMCLLHGMLSVDVADEGGRCARGAPSHRSPEMIHVWLFDHPQGRFATSMHLGADQLRRLIERDAARATP